MAERAVRVNAPAPGSTAEAAVAALAAAREASTNDDVAKGEGISSMNRLLQWGAANASGPEAAAATARQLQARTPEQLREDRAWIDAAFPDMFDEVKHLTALLTGTPVKPGGPVPAPPESLSEETLVDILNGIEEYMADLNFATNIAKLGTLPPVVRLARHSSPAVRAAALWVLGTAMQDVDDVKAQVLAGGGLAPIVAGLSDPQHAPRAKACTATSALLKHAGEDTRRAFEDAGGVRPFLATAGDANAAVRRRSQFLLQHAESAGASWLLEALVRDREAVRGLVGSLDGADAGDSASVEAAAGAIGAVAEHDRMRLLEYAPALPGVITRVRAGATAPETRKELDLLLTKLTTSLPSV